MEERGGQSGRDQLGVLSHMDAQPGILPGERKRKETGRGGEEPEDTWRRGGRKRKAPLARLVASDLSEGHTQSPCWVLNSEWDQPISN